MEIVPVSQVGEQDVVPSWPDTLVLATQPSGGSGQDANDIIWAYPKITLLDKALREAPDGRNNPRFRLTVQSGVHLQRRGGDADALSRLLLASVNPSVHPPWADTTLVWPCEDPQTREEWLRWLELYMNACPMDWGWRARTRDDNLQSAADHSVGRWTGTFGRTLLRNGFVVVRGLLNSTQVDLLRACNREHHKDRDCGEGLHHPNGVRGIAVYVHPDSPEADPWPRSENAQIFIGPEHPQLKEWQGVMETLRKRAGRKSWPHDIDMMASWPGGQPQEMHQDGTFSMLACTVFLGPSQGTHFADYKGKEVMGMGHANRVQWLQEQFKTASTNVVKTGDMFGGDVIFFHTAHIHRAPPAPAPNRRGHAKEPRRTFFFGFDSDQKTCETEFIVARHCKEHWEAFEDGKYAKNRRQIRKAALLENNPPKKKPKFQLAN